METTRSEDTLVFLALDRKKTKMSVVASKLKRFFQSKQDIDPNDRFNFITFERNKPVYLEDFSFNIDYIISTFKEIIPRIESLNMAGGIFVAITFIIDVFKIVGGKTFRLLIITDKNTPSLKNIEVLDDLVEKISSFPFFIDVIRINIRDHEEDQKWTNLVKKTSGKMKFVNDEKELDRIFADLAKKKRIKLSGFIDKSKIYISADNEMFFENIAEDITSISDENHEMKCQICGLNRNPDYNSSLYKCGKCGVTIHKECSALWAKFSNVGMNLPHLYRCQNCFNLLKLSRNFVEAIQLGKKPEEVIADTTVFSDIADILFEREKEKGELKLIHGENPFQYEEEVPENLEEIKEQEEKITIVFCPSCGKTLSSNSSFCLGCGYNIGA
jgi:hypothetical protein